MSRKLQGYSLIICGRIQMGLGRILMSAGKGLAQANVQTNSQDSSAPPRFSTRLARNTVYWLLGFLFFTWLYNRKEPGETPNQLVVRGVLFLLASVAESWYEVARARRKATSERRTS